MLRGEEGPMDVDAPPHAGAFRSVRSASSRGTLYAFGSTSATSEGALQKRKRIVASGSIPFSFQSSFDTVSMPAQRSASASKASGSIVTPASASSRKSTPLSTYSDPPSPALPKSPENDELPHLDTTPTQPLLSRKRVQSYEPNYTSTTNTGVTNTPTGNTQSPNIFAPVTRSSPLRTPSSAQRGEALRKRRSGHVSKKLVRLWEATQVDTSGSDSERLDRRVSTSRRGRGGDITEDDSESYEGTPYTKHMQPPFHMLHENLQKPQRQASDLPSTILSYLQVTVGCGLVFGLFYIVVLLYTSVQQDLNIKAQEVSTGILNEIAECAKLYKENRCHPSTRVPGMHKECTIWEQCMSRDPAKVVTMQVSAEAFAEIIEHFVARLSYKTMGFFTLLLSTFLLLNMSCSCLRKRPPQQQYYEPPPPVPVTPYYTPGHNAQPYYQLYSPYSPTPQFKRSAVSKRRARKRDYDDDPFMN